MQSYFEYIGFHKLTIEISIRVDALQALEMMQALPSDSSDGAISDNEKYDAASAAEAVAELEAESSDFKGE